MEKEKKILFASIAFCIVSIIGVFWILKFNIASLLINGILVVLLYRAIQELLGVHPTQTQSEYTTEVSEQNTPITEEVVANETNIQNLNLNNTEKIKCPNCHSLDVHFMGNNRKAFSVGKAAAGAVLTGGIGTLAGFAGKKGKKQWFCKGCNQIFETK